MCEPRYSDSGSYSESAGIGFNESEKRGHDFISGAIILIGIVCIAIVSIGRQYN